MCAIGARARAVGGGVGYGRDGYRGEVAIGGRWL